MKITETYVTFVCCSLLCNLQYHIFISRFASLSYSFSSPLCSCFRIELIGQFLIKHMAGESQVAIDTHFSSC